MMFDRLDVLNAFLTCDFFQLTMDLLGYNSVVSQGAAILRNAH